MIVAGAVADVPWQAPGLQWLTIGVRVRALFDPRLRECERAMGGRIGSKSARNSPYPGPKNRKIASTSPRYKQVTAVLNVPYLILDLRSSMRVRASSSDCARRAPDPV